MTDTEVRQIQLKLLLAWVVIDQLCPGCGHWLTDGICKNHGCE